MTQEELEALYSQRNINTVLHESIRYELDKSLLNWSLKACFKITEWLDGTYYTSKNARLHLLKQMIDEKGMDSIIVPMVAAVLHTHTTQTIQQCVGYLQAYMPHEDTFHRAKTAAELLGLCSEENGLFTIQRHGSGQPATIKIPHWNYIDKKLLCSFDWINDTCFNPPMIEPPQIIEDNFHCGYKTLNEPLLLGKQTIHNLKQNYDANNILNQIQWVLDQDVLAEPEVPAKPLVTKEQHEQFVAMAQASRFIYKLLGKNPFHLCWQNDSRGRLYSHGYHVNFQAAEYKKASLSFNKYEVLT